MNKKLTILLFALQIISTESDAQGKRFYIANDDHTDYVWSANEAVYKNAMLTTLDKYLIQLFQQVFHSGTRPNTIVIEVFGFGYMKETGLRLR